MSEKYKNKYRIPSARLQTWDYGSDAAYFITVCTRNREHYFGEIENGRMKLSQVGVIADIIWYEIVKHSKHVELGEFIVMPNHIHGIIIINSDNVETSPVETGHALSLPTQTEIKSQTRFQNIGKNTVSSIIGSYKSAVTKHARRLGFDFEWQTRFHDHIIRDEKSHRTISEYIIENPEKWSDDTYFK